MVPPFHPELVRGVATYAYELFTAVPDLHTVYVPIGCGSGICGTILARDALGLDCEVVGVVSDRGADRETVGRGGAAGRDQLGPHLRRRHGGAGPGAGGL